jgi:hypothetical protein
MMKAGGAGFLRHGLENRNASEAFLDRRLFPE